jgi:hypothetical protein
MSAVSTNYVIIMARTRKSELQSAPEAQAPEQEEVTSQPQPQAQPQPQPEPEDQLSKDVPSPAEPATMAEQPEETPFDEMIRREYELALDEQIKKAVDKINRRATALMSQESSITDVILDNLGHDSDWYEDLALAVQNKDPRVGQMKEDVYKYLADLGFTEMKPLESIKQMYPTREQA